MIHDNDIVLPAVPPLQEKEVVEKPVRKFTPDYKYMSSEDVKAITVGQLAKLEAELHTLRIVYFAHGENPDVMVAPNRTIGQEIQNVMGSLLRISDYFSAVLEG